MKRLLIVNTVTACLVVLALALEGLPVLAFCVALMMFSASGASYYLGKGRR